MIYLEFSFIQLNEKKMSNNPPALKPRVVFLFRVWRITKDAQGDGAIPAFGVGEWICRGGREDPWCVIWGRRTGKKK